MIEVSNLNVSIEGTPILRDISLIVPKGEMVGLVGRNGAGKTTLMRSIMGLARPDSGRIRIGQTDATTEAGFWRARHHVGYMPEDRRLVPDLSVEENMLIPAWATHLEAPEQKLEAIYELMPEVRQFAPRPATSLSGGQQKLVAMARALMIGQETLLLDEPFEGVAPTLCKRLVDVIMALKGKGLSVLISESDYTYTRGIVDRSYAIERGSVSTGSHTAKAL
ncbi:ATP-binding cassette domain-containing protein [Castellaniella sp.]|uniref:ATP-binding cassette domain-containing protein n=1 Tax=Castellaniella sp. TaxID=1955812 RepID=UPI002AFEBFBB|nr:ATP-binding cassette domain-containing protein [Castellaniella sp.]